MVVLNQPHSDNPMMYDLSFMYSLRCNLSCSFCMYSSGPDCTTTLSLKELSHWLITVDMSRIASFGIYGGEPSIDLRGFGACLDLVHHLRKPAFVITNGTWSRKTEDTLRFLSFCEKYHLHIVISGTPEHLVHQNRAVLQAIKDRHPDAIRLKPEEENFHAMGRLAGSMPIACHRKCMTWKRAIRIAVTPSGSILFQNCAGVYPVVGNIAEPWEVVDSRVSQLRRDGFTPVCPYYDSQADPCDEY